MMRRGWMRHFREFTVEDLLLHARLRVRTAIALRATVAAILSVFSATALADATYNRTESPQLTITDDAYSGAISSMNCSNVSVAASATGSITGTSVSVNMFHSWVGDLTLKLVHPDNTVVTLMSRPGLVETADNGQDAGTGNSADLLGNLITFVQGASASAENMGNGMSTSTAVCQSDGVCSFAPAKGSASGGDLTTFNGKTAAGTWRLCIGDSNYGDSGTLSQWSLTLAGVLKGPDLAITKTNNTNAVNAGDPVTYTIVASNLNAVNAPTVNVVDTLSSKLSNATWSCVGSGGGTCTANGTGNIAENAVNLPSGAFVTYTLTATVLANAVGSLDNTATVSLPAGSTDADTTNNSATDSDTIVAQADLSISNSDGVTTATAGGSVTYTIVASNSGPNAANAATVTDTFPAGLSGTWTCVGAGGGACTGSGSGSINQSVDLPSGGSVTFTVSGTVSPGATGTLVNTASISNGSGSHDPDTSDNSAVDTDTIARSADLGISKTDGVTTVPAGTTVVYTIVASNAGPSNAPGAVVADTLPTAVTGSWTCVGTGGGTCTASGSGNINDAANIPAGGSVTYTVTASINSSATGSLVNTATVTAPGGVADSVPGNNSATDTDTLTAVTTPPSGGGGGGLNLLALLPLAAAARRKLLRKKGG